MIVCVGAFEGTHADYIYPLYLYHYSCSEDIEQNEEGILYYVGKAF